jgi:hypothetical protein
MKTLTYLFALVALLYTSVGYSQDFPPGPTTTIEFEETEYDFDTITSGEVVSQVYTFTNIGDQPFIISNARGSCGCTVPQWPREAIAPGEQGKIKVEFNSKNKRGRRMQKVTITGNTNPPQTFIYLKGFVLAEEVEEQEVPVPDFLSKEAIEQLDCFAIFPNPTADLLQLDIDGKIGQAAEVKIFAKSGRLVESRSIPAITNEPVSFDVSQYPAGSYIATIQIGQNRPQSKCFVVSGQ